MTNLKTSNALKLFTKVLFIFFIASYPLRASSANKKNNQDTIKQNQSKTNNMKKILIIGMNPRTIDFTNPELPKGVTIELIEQGTKATVDKLISNGYDTELFLIETGATDLSDLENQLKEKNYDGVVIGNGIRGIKENFILFELIVNLVHTSVPKSKIIFNALPSDTEQAVKRWL